MKKWMVVALAGLLVAMALANALGEPSVGGMSAEDTAVVDDFIENFKLLAAIPRQSEHEQAVSDYLKG